MTPISSNIGSVHSHRAGSWAVRALVACAALIPLAASAQTSVDNIRYVGMGDRWLVETAPGKWSLSGLYEYQESQRTATSIQMRPKVAGAGAVPLSVNLALRHVFMGFDEVNRWTNVAEYGATSGLTVSRVDVLLQKWDPVTRTAVPGAPTYGRFEANAGSAPSWSLAFNNVPGSNFYLPGSTLPAGSVVRSPRTVVLKSSLGDITLDVVSGSCSFPGGYLCSVQNAFDSNGWNVGHFKIESIGAITPVPFKGTLTQTATKTWRLEQNGGGIDATETARESDFVEMRYPNGYMQRYFIGGVVQKPVAPGQWGADPISRVLSAHRQWPGQLGTVPVPVSPGVSPGFQIQNMTDYPVLVTLEQVGCLYYGIVQPGQVFERNTGAVWFTIKAAMAPDLREPTVESCLVKPAIFTAKVLAAGAMIAGTMGTATALVVPAMLATAAGEGSAIAVTAYAVSQGASATDAASTKVLVTTLTRGATVVGLVLASGTSLPFAAAAALKDSWLNVGPNLAFIGGTDLYTRMTAQSDVDGFDGQLTQQTSVTGAYAGYPWPWTMADRVMPRYNITGGPRIRTMADGTTVMLKQDTPLTITKVN
jgi:hypothetical protein